MKNLIFYQLLFSFILLLVSLNVKAQVSGDTTLCEGESSTYLTTINANSYTWNITGSISFASNNKEVTVVWGSAGIGIVQLLAYDNNGIEIGNYSYYVNINPSPSATFTPNFYTSCLSSSEPSGDSCYSACVSQPMRYTAPVDSSTTYSWSVIGSTNWINISPNEIEVIWPTVGIHRIELSALSQEGCISYYEKCIQVLDIPTSKIGVGSQLAGDSITICQGSELYFTDLSEEHSTVLWNFGNGNYSSKFNETTSYNSAGYYDVILSVRNQCGCFDRDTLSVYVEGSTGPDIICPAVVCSGDTVSYSTSSICSSFIWSVKNGEIIGDSTGSSVDVVWNKHLGYISLSDFGCQGGCTEPTTKKIAVLADSIPIYGDINVCKTNVYTYWVEPIPGSIYSWSIDPSLGTINEAREYEVDVQLSGNSGSLYLSYSNPILGCSGSTYLEIETKPILSVDYQDRYCKNDQSLFVSSLPVNWNLKNDIDSTLISSSESTELQINWSNYQSGYYTIEALGGSSYCNDFNFTFQLLDSVPAPDTIYGEKLICNGNAYQYSVKPLAEHAVEWLITGGTPGATSGNPITINWDSTASSYEIKAAYRQISEPNCLSSYRIKSVSKNSTTNKQILGLDSACGSDTVTYYLNFISDNVRWEIIPSTAGTIITDRFLDTVKVVYDASSSQTSSIKAIGTLCNVDFSILKNIYSKGFNIPSLVISDSLPCQGSKVTFSTNVSSPLWNIGGVMYNSASPEVTLDSIGTFNIQVSGLFYGPQQCSVELSNVGKVSVRSNPKATIAARDSNDCGVPVSTILLNAGLQGTSNTGNTYTWNKNGQFYSSNSQISIPPGVNSIGTYSVIIQGNNGCIDSTTYIVSDSCIGGGCHALKNDTITWPSDTIYSYDSTTNTYSIDSIIYSQTTEVNSVTLFFKDIGCHSYELDSIATIGCTLLPNISIYKGSSGINEIPNNSPYGIGFKINRVGTTTLGFQGQVINTVPFSPPGNHNLSNIDTLCFDILIDFDADVIPNFNIALNNCGNGLYQYKLNNTSSYVGSTPISFVWDFGTTYILDTNQYDPILSYHFGSKTISLTDTISGCSISKSIDVPQPTVASINIPSSVCQQEPITLGNLSNGDIVNYKWVVGSKTSYEYQPTISFEHQSGNRTINYNQFVNLYIVDKFGCKDTASQAIGVKGNLFSGEIFPNSNISFCIGDSISLQHFNLPPNTNTPISYLWSTNESSAILQAKSTGYYSVNLKDVYGCRFNTKPVNVEVKHSASPAIVGKETYCPNESVKLETHNFPKLGVKWFKDSVFTGETGAVYKEKLNPGLYQFYIEFSDSSTGCNTVSSFHTVEVLSVPPSPNISANALPVCENQNIQLTANLSGQQFYWNTGEFGNSITAYSADSYEAFYINSSGCVGKDTLTVHPLPDFSNFMVGCYCIPLGNTDSLLGIPNMFSYQWKLFDSTISAPIGTSKNILPDIGSYSLIAESNEGCIDSLGTIDITKGGCNDCTVNLIDVELNCLQINPDSLVYSFSIELSFQGDSLFDYNTNLSALLGSLPLSISGISTTTINDTTQYVTGILIIDSIGPSDTICFSIIASNPGVSCSDQICIPRPPICDLSADFTIDINPYSCSISLESNNYLNDCLDSLTSIHSWTLTQDSITLIDSGHSVIFSNLVNDSATICYTYKVFNPYDSTYCEKDTCRIILIPDCSCQNNCSNQISNVEYIELDDDSCLYTIKFEVENTLNQDISINHIATLDGQILSYQSTFGGFGTSAFLLNFLADSSFNGGQACFDVYLKIDGVDCCTTICVNLPSCSCDLGLSSLVVGCNGPNGSPGQLQFSFGALLTAASGFNYNTTLKVYYNSSLMNIQNWSPSVIDSGSHIVSGLVDIINPVFGDSVCFELEAEFEGRSCIESLCIPLPDDTCFSTPSFTYSIDSVTCALTLTDNSIIDSCTHVINSNYKWDISWGTGGKNTTGKSVTLSGLPPGFAVVCHEVLGLNFYNNFDCHPQVCDTIEIPNCLGASSCQGFSVINQEQVEIISASEPCEISISFELWNPENTNFSIAGISSSNGFVTSYSNTGGTNKNSEYSLDFEAFESFEGGEVCFSIFLLIEGEVCIVSFCIELSCEEVEESNLMRKGLSQGIVDQQAEWQVFPNPATNSLSIDYHLGSSRLTTIEILSNTGVILLEEVSNFKNGSLSLDIGHISSGTYFLRLTNDIETKVKKFSILK